MRLETLLHFKERVEAFNNAVVPVLRHYNFPSYITLEVLLQNLYANTSKYAHFNLEEENKKCANIIQIIKGIAKYNKNCHITNWIANELDMLETGAIMSELEPNNIVYDNYQT